MSTLAAMARAIGQARVGDVAAMDGAFAQQQLTVAGRVLIADRSGALYWPARHTLIVADLHLEKGSAQAERGSFIPPYDTRTTLGRLLRVIDYFDPDVVIALGDSLHDKGAAGRLLDDDLEVILALQDGRAWHWITGNHDPDIPAALGGMVAREMELDGLVLRHEPLAGPLSGEIAGHMHPAARIARHGLILRRPCFVSNGQRLIMPAFGTYTGGLNVLDDAYLPLLGSAGIAVWMIGHEGLYPIATRQLCGD